MSKKWMKVIGMILCLALLSTVILTACSKSGDNDNNGGSKGDQLKVALLTDAAGQNDNGYNQSAVEGLKEAAAQYNMDFNVVDKSEDVPGALTQLAESGYKLIFSLEYNFEALINGVGGAKPIAEQYPDTTFVVFNDMPNQDESGNAIHSNVVSVLFDVHEASFLAGALSVLVNENAEELFGDTHNFTTGDAGRKLGFIGGTKSNGITVFSYGYAQGADYVASDLGVNYTLYTDYSAGFSDSAAGATKANTYYADGANVVVSIAGAVGDGVTSKAKEVKKLAIEADANKDANQAGYILTSILKNTRVPVMEIMKLYSENNLAEVAGKIVPYSLGSGATGVTDLATIEGFVVDSGKAKFEEIKTKLNEISGLIADGTIDVVDAQAGESLDLSTLKNVTMPND